MPPSIASCRLAGPALALLVAVAGTTSARPAAADDPEAARLSLTTERVVVFKDGYALFVKRGTAKADASGRVFTEQVPDGAVLGCFFATATDRRVLALHAGWVETETTQERTESCLTVADLLRANAGRDVVLGLVREGEAAVVGRVVGLLEAPARRPKRTPGAPSGAPPGETVTPTTSMIGGTHVALDVSGRRLVLPVAEIRTVSGADLVTTIVRQETVVRRTKRLTVDLGRAAAGVPVAVSLLYFTEGVRWIPTYRVSGDLEGNADLSLTGEVINDAEDVADAAFDLVVGVPSFRFKDTVSPLTLQAALAGAAAAQERAYGARRSDALRSQAFSNMTSNSFRNEAEAEPAAAATGGALLAAPELATDALQDLYLYSLPSVTLRRGERTALALWETSVPVRHVYSAELAVVRHARGEGQTARSRREATLAADAGPRVLGATGLVPVWHDLELTNATKVPWTTGAALVTRGPLPIAQNLLGYTSPGVTSRLPLTVAVDVASRWAEEELEREARAVVHQNVTLAVVRKRGTLTVTNRRATPSAVLATLSTGGRVEVASDGGRVTLNEGRREDWSDWPWWWWGAVAQHSDVAWSFTLAPGETKALTVEFTFPAP